VKNKSHIWIIILVIALIGGMVLLIWGSQPGKQYIWNETYKTYDKNPYGAYVFYELLKNEFDKQGFHEINIHTDEYFEFPIRDTTSNYVFMGMRYFTDYAQFDRVIDFAEQGNQVFLIIKYPQEAAGILVDLMDENISLGFKNKLSIETNFLHPGIRNDKDYTYYFRNDHDTVLLPYWAYFTPESVNGNDSSRFEEIGSFNDSSYNVIRVQWGKGSIMIHTTPVAFSNYYLKDSFYLGYLEALLGHFNDGPVYYDIYNQYQHYSYQQESISQRENVFQFILAKPPLKWGWYLFLSGMLLFMIFRARRKQRIIPVLPVKENTSLEYIETIGALYFQQKDHRKLALKEMKNAMSYIHRNYHLTAKELDDKIIQKLSAKTGIPEVLLQKIKNEHHWIKQAHEISEERLTDIYRLLNHIYKIEEHG
jgi:Domain of unknown function (DUF4350)